MAVLGGGGTLGNVVDTRWGGQGGPGTHRGRTAGAAGASSAGLELSSRRLMGRLPLGTARGSGLPGAVPARRVGGCVAGTQLFFSEGVGGARAGAAFLYRTETFFFFYFHFWPISVSQAGKNKKHKRKQLREGTEGPRRLLWGEQAFCQSWFLHSLLGFLPCSPHSAVITAITSLPPGPAGGLLSART